MRQTVWIARHGNRLDFVNPSWFETAARPYDPPLSNDGVVQARELGQRLAGEKICHIFASPFWRTVATACEIAEILDLPIAIEEGLSEWLNPYWMPEMPEKMSLAELCDRYPRIDTSYESRVKANYPESEQDVNERAGKTARILAEEFGTDILLVGHGASVIGATWGLVRGNPEVNAALCCLVKVVWSEEGWVMELNGDTSHLSSSENRIRFI